MKSRAIAMLVLLVLVFAGVGSFYALMKIVPARNDSGKITHSSNELGRRVDSAPILTHCEKLLMSDGPISANWRSMHSAFPTFKPVLEIVSANTNVMCEVGPGAGLSTAIFLAAGTQATLFYPPFIPSRNDCVASKEAFLR